MQDAFAMPSTVMTQLSAIRKVMVKSLEENFVPFPVNKSACSKWTTELPHGGETVMYTSFMYQLSGLFKSYEKRLKTFTGLGGSTTLAEIGRFFMKPGKDELERSYRILRNISGMLLRAGVKHGYLYEDEPYSGGLLLELGMLDEFYRYGKKVLELFESKGVKTVITLDPHTTNAIARLIEHHGSSLEMKNYLTLVRPRSGSGEYVLHDPCLYTRYNSLGPVMRKVVTEAGVKLKEDRMVTGREYGTCCGGPVGPVDVELSDNIASGRVKRLLSVSKNVMVACPLCYQKLSQYAKGIKDIAEVVS